MAGLAAETAGSGRSFGIMLYRCYLIQENEMPKSKGAPQKETKTKPAKTLKEKRAEKRATKE